MLQKKIIQLKKSAYHIIQDIGFGASGTVYLVSRLESQTKEQQVSFPTASTVQNERQTFLQQELENEPLKIYNQPSIEVKTILDNIESYRCSYHSFPINESPIQKQKQQQLFALKAIFLQFDNAQSRKKQQQYKNELQILLSLNHPGVISIKDYGIESQKEAKSLNMIIDWGRGGTLIRFLELIQDESKFFEQKQVIYQYYISQIVIIIEYLQSKGISHCDLKGQNFILDENYRLKIIDFGSAEIFDHSKITLKQPDIQSVLVPQKLDKSFIGSIHFISPEMIERNRMASSDRYLCRKTDIWSLGVLIYYMFAHQFPYVAKNTYYTAESILNKEVNFNMIDNIKVKELLQKILVKNPEKRIDIKSIKSDPYFEGIHFESIFLIESPSIKFIKQLENNYVFKEELVSKTNNQVRRRIVGILNIKRFNQISIKDIKRYLTIGKIHSLAMPTKLEIFPNTTLRVTKDSCVIIWDKKQTARSNLEYPQFIELKFNSPEQKQRFIDSFKQMKPEDK